MVPSDEPTTRRAGWVTSRVPMAVVGTGLVLAGLFVTQPRLMDEHQPVVGGAAAAAVLLGSIAFAAWYRQRAVHGDHLTRTRAEMLSLLDHAGDAIVFLRRDGRIFYANRRAEEMYGYSGEELRRRFVHELRADRDRGEANRIAETVLHQGGLLFESINRHRDGATFAVEISRTSFEYEGEPAFLSIARRIGDRGAQERLRAGELLVLEKIASGAPLPETLSTLITIIEEQCPSTLGSVLLVEDGVRVRHGAAPRLPPEFVAAIDGRTIGPGRGACGTAAFTRQTVVSADIATDPAWTEFREAALAAGLRACWSVPILAADGSVYGTFALYHPEPRPAAAEDLALVRRATHLAAIAIHRHRAEEALRAQETELRNIFENVAIGIALGEMDGRSRRSNPAFRRFLGYSAEELARMPFREFSHPEDLDRDLELFGSLLAGERDTYELEKRFIRKDGETVWGRITVSILRRDGPNVQVIGTIEDITERRRLQRTIEASQKMEAVGLLAGGIAHDFNNLLAVMLGHGELARHRLEPGHPARVRIDGIMAAAERAAGLTRQLLAFSRRQTFQVEVLDLNAVVEEMTKILRRILGEDVKLALYPHPELGRVQADRSQIDQILMNLAVNARDAMPGGGALTIETRNAEVDEITARRHSEAKPGSYVVIRVRDTGGGMSSDTVARVFEPFFTTKEPGKGTGLGLSTVYGIVTQSGGFVDVDSQLGRGTCFDIYLPRVEEPVTTVAAASGDDLRGTETILVAEDEPDLRELIVEGLESHGYTVLVATGSDEVLRLAREHPGAIDLLLTDVVMPEINGREMAQRVTAVRPGIKVLYMSGYTADVVSRHGVFEEGTLLMKPFTTDTLAAKLRGVLSAPAVT